MKTFNFMKYFTIDKYKEFQLRREGIVPFKEYGLRLYTGCQGSGKTTSMIEELEYYRKSYEGLFIATNCNYEHQDMAIQSLDDLVELPKIVRELGYQGLVIAFDEIQNDFDNTMRTFPITVLRTITQQRKQAIKILATSQVFTRVTKAVREQTFEVVQCKTVANRWVFQKWYDPVEFEYHIQNPAREDKLKVTRKYNFVQSDDLRSLYDSYAVIDSLKPVQLETIMDRINRGNKKNDMTIKELQGGY